MVINSSVVMEPFPSLSNSRKASRYSDYEIEKQLDEIEKQLNEIEEQLKIF